MNKMFFGKFEKGTDRLIGYLSKGKRRWLPEVSKHEHLVLRTKSDEERIIKDFDSMYGWQKSHKYYYKPVQQ